MTCKKRRYRRPDPMQDVMKMTIGTTKAMVGLGVGMALIDATKKLGKK